MKNVTKKYMPVHMAEVGLLKSTGEPDDLEILYVRFGGRLEKCLYDK